MWKAGKFVITGKTGDVRGRCMEQEELLELLQNVASGRVTPDTAAGAIRQEAYTELGYAKIDNQRGIRQGIAEVIYGAGKTKEQITGIVQAMQKNHQKTILITRMEKDAADYLKEAVGEYFYDVQSKVGIVGTIPKPYGLGKIVVATGGTSDIPVAQEAALTAEVLGSEVVRLYDVGVAGIHRLFDHMDTIMDAQVIIAVAGMEGALASVIGGLADCPVIAVPTSVGYGASFHGLSALLSMLNSCASGVSVVNIDNGFGAGYMASMINHMKPKSRGEQGSENNLS